MPKINVYLPEQLATAVREAQVPVSAICQAALEKAVRDVGAAHGTDEPEQGPVRGRLFRRFTPRARNAVEAAEKEARELGHPYLGTEHLLLGVLHDDENLAIRVLKTLEIDPNDLRSELIASLGPRDGNEPARVPFTRLAKDVLANAATEALTLGHNYIGCEHLLLGLVSVDEGVASRVLRRMGVELRTTRQAVSAALAGVIHAKHFTQMRVTSDLPRDEVLSEILRRLRAIEERLAG